MDREGASRGWLLAGPIATGVYIDAVVIGGWLTPGYSHIAESISGLMIGDPTATTIVTSLFVIYNGLLAVFGIGLAGGLADRGARYPLLAPVLILVTAAAGFGMLFFSTDPIGAPVSFAGATHIVLAGLASVATMLAMLSVALSLTARGSRATAIYSLASMQTVFASGAVAAVAASWGSPLMGLAERVTIGAFLQWVLVLGLVFMRAQAREGTIRRTQQGPRSWARE